VPPKSKNVLRSSPASGLATLSTPNGVSNLISDEIEEEPAGFFGSGLAQGAILFSEIGFLPNKNIRNLQK
jgi:hypothetical protein